MGGSHAQEVLGHMGNAEGDSNMSELSELGEFIEAAAERIGERGRQERRWLENWQQEFAEAEAGGDDEALALLVDVLVAFDAVQAQKRPTRLRRVA